MAANRKSTLVCEYSQLDKFCSAVLFDGVPRKKTAKLYKDAHIFFQEKLFRWHCINFHFLLLFLLSQLLFYLALFWFSVMSRILLDMSLLRFYYLPKCDLYCVQVAPLDTLSCLPRMRSLAHLGELQRSWLSWLGSAMLGQVSQQIAVRLRCKLFWTFLNS